MSRRRRLREGDEVLVPVAGQLRRGELVGFDAPETRRRADVQFEDGTQSRFDTYLLRPAPRRRGHWWWPKELGHQIALISTIFTAVSAVVAVITLILTGVIGGRGGMTSAHATASSTAPSTASSAAPADSGAAAAQFDLDASMVAYNTAYGKHWGTSIKADGYDPLKFRVRVANLASTPTPDLALDLLYTKTESTSFIAGFHKVGTTTSSALGPRVRISAYSAFGSFFMQSANVVDSQGNVVRALDAPVRDDGVRLPSSAQYAGSYDIGVIQPHKQMTVELSGTFATPDSGQLAGGPIIKFRSSAADEYDSTGAARVGDRLRFSIMVDNAGFRAVQVHLRVAIAPPRPSRFVKVTVVASQNGERAKTLGRAIVNAKGDRPISLALVPRTTLLLSGRNGCSSPRLIAHLPDGLAEGGLDVGAVGGFRPRDPCHGTEFTRFVNFTADVR